MGGPQPAQTQTQFNRKGARRLGRAIKPGQGEQVTPFKPASLQHNHGNDPVVEKHIVQHTKSRRFSSSFLQPEQFLAELRVNHGAGLGFQVDAKPSKEIQQPQEIVEEPKPEAMQQIPKGLESEKKDLEAETKDLELFYESANDVPKLELSFEGKPAPAPAHLRTKAAAAPSPSPTLIIPINSGIVCESTSPGSAKNNEETSDSCAPVASPRRLQKSSSQGSDRVWSPSLHRMREKLVRNLSGRKEKESEGQESAVSESNGGKQPGRLRRMLDSMKLRKKTQGEEVSESTEVFEEECYSPRSSTSSVSTTYSEASFKPQSYKRAHRKSRRSLEQLWSSRARQEEEADARIFKAVRQGSMFHGLEEPEPKTTAISKLVAKHRRNCTWDNSTDHIFSPRQPRLPSRDAHVLLAPPKRLNGSNREPDAHVRKTNPSLLNNAPPLGAELLPSLPSRESSMRSVPESPGRRALRDSELPSPPMSPRERDSSQRSSFRGFPGFVAPLPLPETQTSPTSPGLSASSLGLSSSTSPGLRSVGGGAQIMASTSPTLHGASATSPSGAGFQSSLLAGFQSSLSAGLDTRRLEQFPLEDGLFSGVSALESVRSRSDSARNENQNPNASSRPQAILSSEETTYVAAAQDNLSIRSRSDSVSPEKPKSSAPRSSLSFEQIVAGRGRSPPTDNTLMKFFFKCREIEHLNRFLALHKRRFLDSSEKCFHMILSETGGGLSSMVATICTAWLLENTMASATSAKWHPIPVMNMSQKDIWQHRDAAWLFHVCGIDANALLFLDEITPTNETVISGRVKRAVIGQDILVTKDEVASSCTIVAEKFRQEDPKLLQARYMMSLLLAGILVDTHNLSSGSSRDKQQATMLLVGAGSLGRNGFYNQLMNIRDEDYVTTFIKDIYGDSNALTGDKPAQLSPSIEQPKPEMTSDNDKMPAALVLTSRPSTEATMSTNSPIKSRGPQKSKIALVLRLLRNRSSVQ